MSAFVMSAASMRNGRKAASKSGGRPLFSGKAPLVNAGKAPGEWQRLEIRFRAPRFNTAGGKIKDAHFVSVYLNGQLVQEEVSVPRLTVSNPVQGEAATGPVAIQGDCGLVAIRSFVVNPLISNAIGIKIDTWRGGPVGNTSSMLATVRIRCDLHHHCWHVRNRGILGCMESLNRM